MEERPLLLCSYGGEASAPLLRGGDARLLLNIHPTHEQCLDRHYHSFNVVFIDKNAAFIKNKDISKCSQTLERQS